MNDAFSLTWAEANQRYLMDALARVRGHLERRDTGPPDPASASITEMTSPPAIDVVATSCNLSPFERDILLLCAGVELDSAFAAACAMAQGNGDQRHPTFGLALSVLPGAHWSALSPAGPLRHFRLIELGAGNTLTGSPLRIDERVLHQIAGEPHLDERIAGLVEPVSFSPETLVPSHRAVVSRVVAAWRRITPKGVPPIIQLWGPDGDGKRAIAASACAEIGAPLYALISRTGLDESGLARLFTREAVLGRAALLADCDDLDLSDTAHTGQLAKLLDGVSGLLLLSARDPRRLVRRPALLFEVVKPTATEQRALWATAIGGDLFPPMPMPAQTIDRLVSQFDLGAAAIERARTIALARPEATSDPERALWDACRQQARPRLDDLAQRIEGAASWDDLVLPEAQLNVLREIAVHVRQRAKVYDTWGFAAKGSRGLGVSALFFGASGTGKTLAAEVLAETLRLDLYRIDLSSVVSKYIGETEKNLRRVFDAADEGAAILLFDEADAIFGKRSEVKDSHDRYANMEVSYLLQRIETYRGLAILTTNMKSAVDTAFLRRIRFVVQFPYPEVAQRAAIWARVFPAGTPTEGLDLEKLSRLNVAGGNIRNIAINAAFLAAEAGGPVRMIEVMQAARSEYAKMERPMTRDLET